MKIEISDTIGADKNVMYVSDRVRGVFQQLGSGELRNVIEQFRLNLQSRIVGCDDRTLLKLQGNLEYLNEIEKTFKDIIILKKK